MKRPVSARARVASRLLDMLADDDNPASLRPYAYELLARFRLLGLSRCLGTGRAGRRPETRDLALRLKTVKKPPRPGDLMLRRRDR
ncbi:hypothetical protein ACFVY4_33420 [Streptomyces sp. NPDC058299]|uniref:hypothetical protein n=1 Tax=Streptomyces sp. NPDC058299 TaxID=3346435 RepID=UPI0036F07915